MLIFTQNEIADIVGKLSSDRLSTVSQSQSVSATDVGRVRFKNEDAYLDEPEKQLWVVADGMGGHIRGDKASQAVIQAFADIDIALPIGEKLMDVEARLQQAQDVCQNLYQKKVVGSTVVALVLHGGYGFVVWAGDSRVYRVRGDECLQLTTDHTVAQQKFERGELSEEEVDDHSTAHVLTRAVGVHRSVDFEMGYFEVEKGDRFILCSDGLYSGVDTSGMAEVLKNAPIDSAIEVLMSRALAQCGRDNITIIITETV